MKLGVDISLIVDAEDYVEAADHQRNIEVLFSRMKAEYPAAHLKIRNLRSITGERRKRSLKPDSLAHQYEEVG